MISAARLITLGLILLNIFIVTAGQLLLKMGSGKVSSILSNTSGSKILTYFSKIINPYIFSGTLCYVISLLLWIYILTREDLSIAYPLMSLSYIAVMILSIFVLKETVNPLQWAGAFLLISGTTLIFLFK